MWSIIESALTAFTGGGVFGVIASALSQFIKGKAIDKQRAHELEMLKLQTDSERWNVMQQVQAAQHTAEGQARQAAMEWSPYVKGTSQWVKDVRALFRPVLTLVLLVASCVLTVVLIVSARQGGTFAMVVGGDNTISQIVHYGVVSLVFAAVSACTFWYSERSMTPPQFKG